MRVHVRHGGPVVVLALAAVGLVLIDKLEAPGVVAPRAVLWGAALAWFFIGVALRARAWRVIDTPTSKVVAAAVGTSELSGTAIALQPVDARASRTPSVWYRWELQEHRRSGKNAQWVTVDSWEERHPFLLEDDSGTMRVDPAGAEFNGFDTFTFPVPGRGRSWRQLEWRLPDRTTVYLLGPVRADASGANLEVAGEPDDEFVISDDNERQVARRFGLWACVSLLLGSIAATIAPYIVGRADAFGDTGLTIETRGVAQLAFVAGGVYAAALAASWFVRVYNRLVIVRNQAEKAWASIEVQLQRRYALIGDLVAVVRGYVEYEASLQPALAAARAGVALPETSELHAAASYDAAAHAEAQQLLALAESYPRLHGDAQYERLAEALRDTEQRIALSRTFYNDAVNVIRDRRGTFPYLVVAPLVTMPSLELFESTARDAVAIGI